MTTERKILLGAIAGVAVLAVLLFSSQVVEREIAPKPTAARVAIEIGDSGVARTGPVEVTSGTSFRLHAVVVAKTWTGDTVYYTEAEQLELDGESVPVEALRKWRKAIDPRILWFTVEGFTPFLPVDDIQGFDQFRFQELFRADWPRTWSVPGDLRSRGQRDLRSGPIEGLPQFGTQRYHVRVEIFGPESQITPRLRLQSLRAADLPAMENSFATVVATLPGHLESPSAVFGLTQIEPAPERLGALGERLTDWYRRRLTFSRLAVLRDLLDRSGTAYADLVWLGLDLAGGREWNSDGVLPGDLLRVGDRWVVLLEDRGVEHILDREDLCLDFDKGARVRPVGSVFTGDGLVEWTRLPALDPDRQAQGRATGEGR